MKYHVLLTSLVIGLSFQSCNVTKNKETKDNTEELAEKIDQDKMISDGFIKGVIKTSKSRECPYILTIDKYDDKLDPINLNDFFKNEIPEKVWVKFASLRMKNRCEMARPVSITEISKRSE